MVAQPIGAILPCERMQAARFGEQMVIEPIGTAG
jgi:hypothetical protein